jgi:hypothetical protein
MTTRTSHDENMNTNTNHKVTRLRSVFTEPETSNCRHLKTVQRLALQAGPSQAAPIRPHRDRPAQHGLSTAHTKNQNDFKGSRFLGRPPDHSIRPLPWGRAHSDLLLHFDDHRGLVLEVSSHCRLQACPPRGEDFATAAVTLDGLTPTSKSVLGLRRRFLHAETRQTDRNPSTDRRTSH